MKDIEDHFVELLKTAGNPLMERGDDIHFVVHISSAAAAAVGDSARETVIDNPAMAVHEYRIAPNSKVELSGSFKLQRFVATNVCVKCLFNYLFETVICPKNALRKHSRRKVQMNQWIITLVGLAKPIVCFFFLRLSFL